MEFPAYVPAAVRTQIAAMIDGDAWEPHGWAASLASAEQRLSEIEQAIEARTRRGDLDYLLGLRLQKADALKHRDAMAEEVGCLQRLAHDSRMRDAFTLLTREFTDDEQWRGFIRSARAARMDYGRFRERLKEAAELKKEIADAADDLAKLIRQFADFGIDNGPGEFFSVPALLRQTDNHESNGRNLHMWRGLRGYILGDPQRRDIPDIEQGGDDQSTAPGIVRIELVPMEKADTDPTEEMRSTLCYAWDTAPSFPDLLDTVAKAARDFTPSEDGMIGAAIESRQRSAKTEYLRAFWHQLTDVHHFTLTTAVMQAMAIVANVVINLPDIDGVL